MRGKKYLGVVIGAGLLYFAPNARAYDVFEARTKAPASEGHDTGTAIKDNCITFNGPEVGFHASGSTCPSGQTRYWDLPIDANLDACYTPSYFYHNLVVDLYITNTATIGCQGWSVTEDAATWNFSSWQSASAMGFHELALGTLAISKNGYGVIVCSVAIPITNNNYIIGYRYNGRLYTGCGF